MRRQALLLGFFATGAQILLLRELVSSLNGSEFFIGIALAGWLIAVAAGAYLGGKRAHDARTRAAGFALGACLLPVLVALVRLAPLTVTNSPGQMVPVTIAVLVSLLATCPAGALSGWLFSAVTANDKPPDLAIPAVYLWEGIGACVAGLFISVAVGGMATLPLSVVVSALTLGGLFAGRRPASMVGAAALVAASILVSSMGGPKADRFLDGMKFPHYEISRCFDTKYGHQALLYRDSTYALVTDNTVEAVWPDPETAENLLIVPLAYAPHARSVLYLGRAEFGVDVLAARLQGLQLTAVDPRRQLDGMLTFHRDTPTALRRIDTDPIAFLAGRRDTAAFDIIVMPLGDPVSYRTSRLMTKTALAACRKRLRHNGVLCVSVNYDSDRYVSDATVRALAAIRTTLRSVFGNVTLWPGTATILLASDGSSLSLPYDSIISRINGLAVEPLYVNDYYLFDRLNAYKRERLDSALEKYAVCNSIARPVLPYLQMLHASRRNTVDQRVITAVFDGLRWLALLPVAIACFVLISLARGSGRYVPWFLFFVTGLVSLALETIAFYLYQSTAGALYSHLSLLVGSYMLGLSAGVYVALRSRPGSLAVPAIAGLLLAVLFMSVLGRTTPDYALAWYLAVLFFSAASASAVFTDAARRYYAGAPAANRGIAYAWELAGSACAACVTTTVALPLVGLPGLLASLGAVLLLALAGLAVAGRRTRTRG